MNDYYSIKHGGGYDGIIIAAFTALHIIIYLIGKVIFGFIRRQNQKEKEKEKEKQSGNESEKQS